MLCCYKRRRFTQVKPHTIISFFAFSSCLLLCNGYSSNMIEQIQHIVIELKSQCYMLYAVPPLREKSPRKLQQTRLLSPIVSGGFLLFHFGTTYLHTTHYIGKRSNVKMHYRCWRKVKTTDWGTPWRTLSVCKTTNYDTLRRAANPRV